MEENIQNNDEQLMQLELIKNPKYDSDWIAQAAKILVHDGVTVTTADLEELSTPQLALYNEILGFDDKEKATKALNTLFVEHKDLNATQMRLYWIGITKGLTEEIMERFLDPTIPYAKSNFAIEAICKGFTGITEYLDGFDANQVAEIYAGMQDGIDYKSYARPEFPSDLMNLIRHAMCTGYELTISHEGVFSITVNATQESQEAESVEVVE